jgi:hypothetical protein
LIHNLASNRGTVAAEDIFIMPFNTSIKLHLLCEKHRNFLQWSRKLQVAKDLYKLVFLRPEIRTVLGTSSKKKILNWKAKQPLHVQHHIPDTPPYQGDQGEES